MAGRIRYGYLDGNPVVFDDDKAFELVGGKSWGSMNVIDAMHKVRLLGKAEFDEYMPHDAPKPPIG